LGVEIRVHVCDLRVVRSAGEVIERHGGALAFPNAFKIRLVDLRFDPDFRERCDPIEPHAGVDRRAFDDVLLDDETARRCGDGHALRGRSLLAERFDLSVVQTE
jgi:hypothetical protein